MAKVVINETSKELTARERLMIKDSRNAVKLLNATKKENVVIDVAYFVDLTIVADKGEFEDINNFVIVGKDGKKYVTGSEAFKETFKNIYDELSEDDEQDNMTIEVFQLESKKNKGQSFLTCSLV